MSERGTDTVGQLRAPLFVSWQITRDCDLCCLHCCTESAPGKRLPDELDAPLPLRPGQRGLGGGDITEPPGEHDRPDEQRDPERDDDPPEPPHEAPVALEQRGS